jgi:ATP-dependent Clp protease ATP-binding subunit ClpA
MFERFTDRAGKVMSLALAKASEQGDDQVRPLHLLYGLTAAEGVGARALTALGVDTAAVERELDRARGASGHQRTGGDAEALAAIGIDLEEIKRRIEDSFGPGALQRVPLTPRGPLNWTGRPSLAEGSKLTLALAVKEARSLRHTYIGTEHVLLGLMRVAERQPHGDFAAETLRDLGLDPARVRTLVLDELRQLQT